MIASQLDDEVIDGKLCEQYKIPRSVAAKVRTEAWNAILEAGKGDREERAALLVGTARHLYSTSFAKGSFAVCANVLRQLREMFGLVDEVPTGRPTKSKGEFDEDNWSEEDLRHYAETGENPEERRNREKKEQVTAKANPLDDLR